MKFFEYKALCQDGEQCHHLSFVAAVPENVLQQQGRQWLITACVKALRKRVYAEYILQDWLTPLHGEDISKTCVYPAEGMKAIYTITTT